MFAKKHFQWNSLPFLLNNLKDEIIAMDSIPEGGHFFIRRRQLCAFQQAVTHHQTHVLESQEGKSNLDRYRQSLGYSWLQADNAMEHVALDFHTTIYRIGKTNKQTCN